MILKRFSRLIMVSALFATLAYSHADAQLLKDERAENAIAPTLRTPLELQPLGLTYKGFIYRPSFDASIIYDDNVLAEGNNEITDFYTSVASGLKIYSDMDGHQLLLDVRGSFERFADQTNENKEEGSAYMNLVLNPNSKWTIPIQARYIRLVEDRNAPQNQGLSKEPGAIDIFGADATIFRNFSRLSLGVKGAVGGARFEDGETLVTGDRIIRTDIDYNDYEVELKGCYKFLRGTSESETTDNPEHVIFIDLAAGKQDFVRQQFEGATNSFTGDNGDNTRYSAFLGFETTYKGLLFANVGAGYTIRKYGDQNLDDTDELDLEAELSYSVTPKFTVNLDAIRTVEQNNDFIQGFVRQGFGGGGEYEILHDWYANVDVQYTEFEFFDSERLDEEVELEVGLRHIHSQNLHSKIFVKYEQRDSNDPVQEYDRGIMMFTLSGEL